MKKIIILVVTVFSLCGLVNGAYASLLEITLNGSSISESLPLNGVHDVPETQGAAGWYNANLYATANVSLTYEYLGFEAGWTNAFVVDGEQVFWNWSFDGNSASIAGDTATSSATAGSLLDFAFEILAGGNAGNGVANGDNVPPMGTPNNPDNRYSAPNFFLGYVDASHDSVFIALDDGGGPHWSLNTLADDNHDDLVLKVTATPVPEPATLLLLGSGLIGIGVFRNKFKK